MGRKKWGAPLANAVWPVRLWAPRGGCWEEANSPTKKVREENIPAATLRAMERAGRAAERATGLGLAADLLREARPLVDGVVLTTAGGDPAGLDPLLAALA